MPKERKLFTLKQRQEIRDMKLAHPEMTTNDLLEWAASTFGIRVHETTMRKIVKDHRTPDDANIDANVALKRCVLRPPRFQELDSLLYKWLLEIESLSINLSQGLIKRQAYRIANKLNLNEDEMPKFSNGWLYGFMQRHGLKSRRLYGESFSVDMDEAEKGKRKL